MATGQEAGTDHQAKISQRRALLRYPDATHPDDACLADDLISSATRRWNEKSLSLTFANEARKNQIQIDVARGAWNEFSEEQQKYMPHSARIFLDERLPDTKEGQDVRAQVMGGNNYANSGFRSWQNERQKQMLEEMGRDPVIAEGKQRWDDPSYTAQDKLNLAQRIHDIQARAHGAQPATIIHGGDGKLVDPITGAKMTEQAAHLQSEIKGAPGKIKINDPALEGSFDAFVDTVTHEGTHDIQSQIGDRYMALKNIDKKTLKDIGEKSLEDLSPEGLAVYTAERQRRVQEAFPTDSSGWNKELEPGGRLAGVAPMFAHNGSTDGYLASGHAGIKNYKANPVEQHADDVGSISSRYMMGDETQRKRILEEISLYGDITGEAHDRDVAARQRAMTAKDPCP